ncbi:GDP-mannose mannosyl hydrolase (GDPMH) [Durusdinium trenchii]|uniref:GDP-mannose mannosyl hydrolase (GDPMH) n=1 Tax=Durusdinium trenchii TaxID=1381693 RepID=A0ABP0IVI5_9DINO
MIHVPRFITGPFKPNSLFLEDAEYGRALDALVKAVSDVLITSPDGGRIFLGRRKVHPQPDWWYMGGRAKPGETPQQAAARVMRRELGLQLAPARFEVIGSYSMIWAMREQPPAEHGTADISTVHHLVIQPEEEAAVQIDEKEYAESRWFHPEEVLKGEFHPILKQALRDLQAKTTYKALQQAVQQGDEDSRLATLARAFVAAAQESMLPAERGVMQVDFDEASRKYAVTLQEES